MTRAWPVIPGVPAAGHVTAGGVWHPGPVDGCGKCPPDPPPRPEPRHRRPRRGS